MNILLNLATLKSGGGQNVGLNFLECAKNLKYKNFNFTIVTARNSDIHHYLIDNNFKNILIAPRHPLKRILFEIIKGNKIIKDNKIDLIYTYFGYGFYPHNIPQIIGSADSNIYFPEINFWDHYQGITKFKKFVVDRYRIWNLKMAQGVIFENEAMKNRGESLFNLKNSIYIKPSINTNFKTNNFELPLKLKQDNLPICLLLCGWQKNKNYMIIPEVASILKNNGKIFNFIITAPKDYSKEHNEFIQLCAKHDVIDNIHISGNIQKDQLCSLYCQIDYVLLLSKLESFSNNIIESWFFNKTLLISDEIWARSICKDAAIYVKRDSAKDIAYQLNMLESTPNIKLNILSNAQLIKKTYPSIKERTIQELNFLRKIYESY